VRIVYVTEPPHVDGVASTAMRVAERLTAFGHQLLVIASRPARRLPSVRTGFPVVRMASELPTWEEPGSGHPYCLRVDGRVHGWLASKDDAEALARIYREAGRDATISGIDFAGTTTPGSEATPRPAPSQGRPRPRTASPGQ
jgi:hypothetical protein